ncbi:pentraxin-related protein PTX3 [Eucyclogobius newberryi]|uniref:pentraxin-related protein PTX3 n=1 Tax=Eucyclogobius newberryi TaxID=166745 RepID=UPI003B59A928
MFHWRLALALLVLSPSLCLALTYEDDIEVNYGDPFYNEITDAETTQPTQSTVPCTGPDLTKWDKMFSMLENSQMRENMLLQYADDIIKVEMDSLRQEMLRFVAQYGGSCGTAVETAGGKLALQLDNRFKEILEHLNTHENTNVKSGGLQLEQLLQQLVVSAHSQTSRLVKLETSCFIGLPSKTGFQHSKQHHEQEVASQPGYLEAALVALQQSREELEEVLSSVKQRYLPGGCDMALLFPMRSRRIYTSVIPEIPQPLSSFTACLWVKPNGVTNKTVLISYGNRQNPFEIQLLLSHNMAQLTVGGEAHLVEASGVLNPGGTSPWIHLCGAWSSEQGVATLWFNGKRVVIAPGVAEGHVIPPGGSLLLGQERNGCCGAHAVPGFEEGFDQKLAFAGKMTGVNIWDRVLSEEDITLLGQLDSQSCSHRGNVVAWGITEMVPHGGAQFTH